MFNKFQNFFFVLLFFLVATAANALQCEPQVQQFGKIFIKRANNCMMYTDVSSMTSRTFLFTPEGMLFVFIGTEESPKESESTGSKVYYLFPRQSKVPSVIAQTGDTVTIVTPTGLEATFDTNDGALVSLPGMQVWQDPKVNMQNKGGFEILSSKNLYLDCGWMKGTAPNADPKKSCRWISPTGQFCEMSNKKLFKYINGDPVFLWQDAQLSQLLNSEPACKGIL